MTPIEILLLIPTTLGCLCDFANLMYIKENRKPDAKRRISHALFLPQLALYLLPVVMLCQIRGIVFSAAISLIAIHLLIVYFVMTNKKYGKKCAENHRRRMLEIEQES